MQGRKPDVVSPAHFLSDINIFSSLCYILSVVPVLLFISSFFSRTLPYLFGKQTKKQLMNRVRDSFQPHDCKVMEQNLQLLCH